jgi:hypothetical protein
MAAFFTIYGIELAVWKTTHPTGTRHAGYDIQKPVHWLFYKIFPAIFSLETVIHFKNPPPKPYLKYKLHKLGKKYISTKLKIEFRLLAHPLYH